VKLIIIDRDGIVRDRDGAVSAPDAWQALPGSAEAIARLAHAGYHVVVLADRTALERGICDMAEVSVAHGRMIAGIAEAGGRVDAVFYRPSDDAGNGTAGATALRAVLERFPVPADQVPVVVDSLRDLEAAGQAGCRPVLVLTGDGRRTLEAGELPAGTVVRVDLSAVASDLAC
jgi:D-glycero-D-manno-heptose 1,7-bisphosphate phosphatase